MTRVVIAMMGTRLAWGLLAAGLVWGCMVLAAGKPTVRRQTLWVVSPEHQGQIEVRVGDAIQIDTEALPVIPQHLGKSFKANLQGRCLQRIGSLPPEGEGAFQASFYFKAVGVGRTEVSVVLRSAEGEELQRWEYQVNVKVRRDTE